MFTFSFEIIANCTTFNKRSDYSRIYEAYETNKIPDDEDCDFSKQKTDFFIKKIYPFILIPFCYIVLNILSKYFYLFFPDF